MISALRLRLFRDFTEGMAAAKRPAPTTSVQDVAAYILSKTGTTTAMKLQKLVYYAQAWHLVVKRGPLFRDAVRAWEQGPVVYSLYTKHKTMRNVGGWPWGDASHISRDDAALLDAVIGIYGNMTPEQLSELTHREDPWSKTPHGRADGEIASQEIPHSVMIRYYAPRKMEIVGKAYSNGSLPVRHVATILESNRSDAMAMLEEHNYYMSEDAIRLTEERRKEIDAKIRADRLRRAGKREVSDERIARSVIATQRIEGVDARSWYKG